jgi:hypothetical protein
MANKQSRLRVEVSYPSPEKGEEQPGFPLFYVVPPVVSNNFTISSRACILAISMAVCPNPFFLFVDAPW